MGGWSGSLMQWQSGKQPTGVDDTFSIPSLPGLPLLSIP